MKIAVGNSRMDKKWKNRDISWEDFCQKVSVTQRTTETVEEYRKMRKGSQDSIKDVGGFVGGTLREGRRKNGMVLCRSMLTLDMDYGKPGIWEEIALLHDFKCCIYSTHKHTLENPRLRLIIPLSRDITEEEYPAVARMVAKQIGIDLFDDTTYEACRLMYWPSTSVNGDFFFDSKDGPELDPDAYLAQYADWRDASTWPVSSRQSEAIRHTIAQQADPLTKPGAVGAFCRAYSIEDAIETFLGDVYAPSAMNGRFDYIPADSSAGVVVYDGKFSYSHHATDPVCGRLLNAFDLVRLHRYRDMDENCPPNTPVGKLPSFKAMTDLALKDERVKAVFAEERAAQAAAEFNDENWQARLELDKAGNIKNTLRNLTIILENDPNLKPLVFNQLLDGMEIKGDVPWKHPSKFWRDADDAQLISYVDTHYGTFSARNYDIAVTKVSDDRSYHPIRAFIEQLPEWDGVERVDTLLIDYLAAEDTPYVRAVTRKTLCAAIKRVLAPGSKFDSMLVLNGPQGVGKSTLIAKLAGEWFSDSLNLSDTKDKTAAEKLQGYWILEIGELAGLRKAEVETLRSFLSRQNDIYRAAFGKRATPHLRQCVFFGTTNAESGYLRDTTGNRRFWPVKTPGGGRKHSWELTEEDIRQIWAEVLVYVERGEKLYLDASMETLAKAEQREAMESDEREGLVRLYLDTLLPEDWSGMDIFERRNFLHGSDFGPAQRQGTVKRTSVSSMEIWCECFGKDRSNLHRSDSNEITGILKRVGWQRAESKVRIPLYGPQYIFVPKGCSE
ncbi:virulence-associated E family protein [Acutalibacter caecimuris]|uniref:virulence-associated E family protein n=1 Tax=Acutalibacter caecimuris TaxID=3093657 RepID=UPI002AC95842|nr:virulence-associated E family protein [Acutalibacter sp. M00118]